LGKEDFVICLKSHGGGVKQEDEIHDTVLIAAAFCMYNRYVDGLATWAPPNPIDYKERAAQVAEGGYLRIPADIKNSQTRQ
jgi:hypothetical protein